jgi:hypothetical protein
MSVSLAEEKTSLPNMLFFLNFQGRERRGRRKEDDG